MCPLLDMTILDLRIRQLSIPREDFCVVTHTHTHASVLALVLSQSSSFASFPALLESKTENAAETFPCCMVLLHDSIPSAHI